MGNFEALPWPSRIHRPTPHLQLGPPTLSAALAISSGAALIRHARLAYVCFGWDKPPPLVWYLSLRWVDQPDPDLKRRAIWTRRLPIETRCISSSPAVQSGFSHSAPPQHQPSCSPASASPVKVHDSLQTASGRPLTRRRQHHHPKKAPPRLSRLELVSAENEPSTPRQSRETISPPLYGGSPCVYPPDSSALALAVVFNWPTTYFW